MAPPSEKDHHEHQRGRPKGGGSRAAPTCGAFSPDIHWQKSRQAFATIRQYCPPDPLLLSEETAERLTMALVEEQVKRRKTGSKVDKSQLIEEMVLKWLEER
jgi:hypothetical protein